MLSKEILQKSLTTTVLGQKIFFFDTIDSTNACARTLAQAGTEQGAIVVAEFQTNGRGRHGRVWEARTQENLLFSVLLRPSVQGQSAGLLTFLAAVGVARGIEDTCECRVECKWPNDLLVNGKKVCGILLENSLDQGRLEHSVLGVGINVNQQTFPKNLDGKATSLSRELRKPIDRVRLFSCVISSLESCYSEIQHGGFESILTDWNSRCTMFGREVTVTQNEDHIRGTAMGIDRDGGLLLQTPLGPRTIYAGDISLLPS